MNLNTQESFLTHNFVSNSMLKRLNRVKFHLSNFNYIRNNLTLESAKLYFNAMIMSHMTYCIMSWALACKTTLKSIET